MAKIVSAETNVIKNKSKVGDLVYITDDWYIIACVTSEDSAKYTFISLSDGNRYINGENSIEDAFACLDKHIKTYKLLEKGSRITLEQE